LHERELIESDGPTNGRLRIGRQMKHNPRTETLMAGHPPSPVDAHKGTVNVRDGTNMLHVCQQPNCLGTHAAPPRNVTKNVLVFDSERLHRFFHSTAYSIAVARNIKLSPMTATDKDSWGVRFFSAVLPNFLHTEEVDLPEAQELDKEADEGANQFGDLFWQELDQRGMQGAIAFLEDVEAQRENAINFTRQKYREAAIYNQGAERSQETFYHGLVIVKCTATIIVAGLSLPFVPGAVAAAGWAGAGAASGWTAFGIGTTYSITLSLVKNWDKADSADLVMVAANKGATKGGHKAVKSGAKFMQKIYEGEGQMTNQQMEFLAGKHWLQKRIAQGDTPEKLAQYARRLANVRVGVKAAQNAYRLSQALKAVPYLMFAWSAKDAFTSAYDEW
jgi:hypothetical protein